MKPILLFLLILSIWPAISSTDSYLLEQSSSALHSIANLDFSKVEPQVTAKLRVLIYEAREKSDSADVWGKLAMNLDVHDFKKEAVEAYKVASALDPSDFRWSYYSAIALNELGSSEALAQFERSCRLKPKYGPARFRYGEALLQANRLSEAEDQFHKVSPATAHSLVSLAVISLVRADLDKAQEDLAAAIKINPKHSEAHALLSQIYRRKSDLHRAREELRISQELPSQLPPDDPELADLIAEGISSYWYEWRGHAYLERGLYEPAIRQLEFAAKISPIPRIQILLGIAYQNAKKFKEAVDQYRLALAKENSAATLNNLASALFELSEYPEAVSTLEKAIKLNPAFAYSYFQLSTFHLRSGNSDEAIVSLQRGHSTIPKNPTLALRLSWLLSTMKNSSARNGAEAIKLAEAVCTNNSDPDPEALDILAAAYAQAGDFDRSVQTAKEAYKMAVDQKNFVFAEKVKLHLKNYETRKPWRE